MSWHVRVDFADDRPRLEISVSTPMLGPAIETALHQLGVSEERTGSYQITITQPRNR